MWSLRDTSRRLMALAALLALACSALAQGDTNAEAISREVSVFNLGEEPGQIEAISREVSVFNLGEEPGQIEAISREVSVLNFSGLTNQPPLILGQPASQTNLVGQTVTFNVVANGTESLSYQWWKDGGLFGGATNPDFTLPNVQGAQRGNYSVVVSNSWGSATSTVATLSVPTLELATLGRGTTAASPPGPAYFPGQQVALTATPYRYYAFVGWSDGNTNNPRTIAIGVSNSLFTAIFTNTVPLEQLTIGGVTRIAPFGTPVVLLNGQFYSNNVVVTTNGASFQATMQSSIPNPLIYYQVDGTDPATQEHEYSGPFNVTAPFSIRMVAYSDDFIQSAEADPVVSLSVTTAGGGSVSNFIQVDPFTGAPTATLTANPLPGWTFMNWAGDGSGTNSFLTIAMDGPKSVQAIFGTTLTTSGAGLVQRQPALTLYPYGSTVRLTAVPTNATTYFRSWGGDASGQSLNPLNYVVTKASTNVSAAFLGLGANRSLTVLINGDGNVTKAPQQSNYAHNASVTLTAVTNAGQLFLNWSGDTNSTANPLALFMNTNKTVTALFAPVGPPVITAQPQSLTVNRDSNATFTVSLTVGATPAYQWFHAGTNLPGATGATLNFASAQKADGGSYQVVVTNIFGSVTSSVAVLTVNLPYTFITIAGVAQQIGNADGTGSAARFNYPSSVAVDTSNNLYVADPVNYTVRKVTPAGVVTTLAGLAGNSGTVDGTGTVARFNYPVGVAVDSAGNIYVSDQASRLRKVTPAGVVTTLTAGFYFPQGVALDASNNVYVAEQAHTIQKVTPAGVVTTLAGLANIAGSVDGTGNVARFFGPLGVAVDSAGYVYVADPGNRTIRKMTATGVVTTLAGLAGSSGSADGTGTVARLNSPEGMAVDSAGNLYVSEAVNATIRKITPDGAVTTIGGTLGSTGSADGTGSAARFYHPAGVAVDAEGNLYVADQINQTIRKGILDYGQPIISSQPQSQTVVAAAAVTLSVTNFGALPVAYQWLFNGTNLADATSTTLNIASFQATNVGSYFVVVSNVYGSATSVVAVLTLPPNTNQPPTVAITSPDEGASFTAPVNIGLSISTSDADGSVTQVTFFAGATLLGRVTNAPFNFTWTNALVGSHSLTAVATDDGGLTATSSNVNITVQTAVPVVDLTSPTNGNTFLAPANILLRAVVSDADSSVAWVDFFNGGTLVGSVTNPPNQPTFQMTLSNVGAGGHAFAAVAHDAFGPVVASGTNSVTVTSIATNPPVFSWSNTLVEVGEAAGSITLHVFKSADSAQVPADIGFHPQSASADTADFTPPGFSQLSFGVGETVKPITISIVNDTLVESNHFFFLVLDLIAGSISGAAEARITILDDDVPGTNSVFTRVAPNALPSPLGTLRVNLSPTNVGQWRFVWENSWHDGGASVAGLPPGNYEIQFKPVSGYVEPLATYVAVITNTLNAYSFVYSNTAAPQLGSLVVNINPAFVATNGNPNERGQWRRTGEGVWHDSGETVDALPAGSVLIEFKLLTAGSWQTPSAQEVTVLPNQLNSALGEYFVANPTPGTGPTPLAFASQVQNPFGFQRGYQFVGQLLTPLGWGSGTVVKQRVVLTAAHVVFNDYALAFVPNDAVKWFFQRQAGEYEPAPQTPRGFVVSSGYAAQRQADASPGLSGTASRDLDIAALYFGESAGRGGFSGYLVSKPGEEWLQIATSASLAGYPVEGIPAQNRGKMHRTEDQAVSWSVVSNQVYATTDIKSYPGNSGGPILVQLATNVNYWPAAVYLGGSGNTIARAIDALAVGLINTAEVLGNAGGNNTGGEPPRRATDCPTCSPLIYGVLEVSLQPTNLGTLGGGYRFKNATNGVIYREPFNRFFVLGNVPWTIEFLPAPYTIAPTNRTITTTAGHTNKTTGLYKQWGQLAFSDGNLRVLGSSSAVYRIDFKPVLTTNVWTPVKTQTLSGAGVTLTNLVPGASNGFFRAVLLP